MTIAHRVSKLALKFGIEVNRYVPSRSVGARLHRMLSFHQIDGVIDIGANTGRYGRSLRDCGFLGDILSFEPLTDAYQVLAAEATGDPRWHVAPRVALGANDGETEINIAGNSTSSSILPMRELHLRAAPQSRYTGVEKVQIRRLDGISHPVLAKNKRLFLKSDTQGYEMQVLLGAETVLHKTRGIQLELSVMPLYQGQSLYREVVDWLACRGFELWSVVPGFTDEATGRMLQFDGVFFREDVDSDFMSKYS